MKLNGASFLELSLSLAFAVGVMSTSLYLIQQATDRVNYSFEFQKTLSNAYQFLIKRSHQGNWNWNMPTVNINDLEPSLGENQITAVSYYDFDNGIWAETSTNISATKVSLNITNEKKISLYMSDSPQKKQLLQKLHLIKKALQLYQTRFLTYPPNNQLNYLVQNSILTELPNNPFTEDKSNLLDWHYNASGTNITIYAYTHPAVQLTFSKI
ncbi:MAG: hypothetical protein ACON35_05555 [Candidatus Marinamargulisbacteria bacterium]